MKVNNIPEFVVVDKILKLNLFHLFLSSIVFKFKVILCKSLYYWRGPGSSVGIATDYGLDGPGNESRWGEIFRCTD
jgi:hypothetical protein